MQPSDFGLIAYIVALSTILSSLYNYGFGITVARETQLMKSDEFSILLSSSWLVCIFLFVFSAFLILAYEEVQIFSTNLDYISLWFASTLGFLLGRFDIHTKILIAKGLTSDYSISELVRITIASVVSIVLVLLLVDDVLARLVGILIGVIVGVVISIFYTRKNFAMKLPTFNSVWYVLITGTKVMPQAIGNWVKMGADKILIASLVGLEQLGIYTFAFSMAACGLLFCNALNQAYLGRVFDLYKNGKIQELAKLRSRYILLSIVLNITLFISLIFYLSYLWPEEYRVSWITIALLVASMQMHLVYLLYSKYLIYAAMLSELSLVNFVMSLMYVAMIWFPSSVPIEYVAFAYFFYNLTMAFYVVVRSFGLEKREFVIA